MTTENLRRETRVDMRVPVVVYRGRSAMPLETADVSFKGLFVRTTEPPALRSLVRLKVAIIGREFEAHAMAVHVVKAGASGEGSANDAAHVPGVGLQFWGLSGPDRTAWDDFVSGLVQARRAAAKKAAIGEHPPVTEAATPSGVHIVVTSSRASTK